MATRRLTRFEKRARTLARTQKQLLEQIHTQGMLVKKDLVERWGVKQRQVERRIRKLGLIPVQVVGLQPVFDVAHVEAMEKKHFQNKLIQQGYAQESQRIITVKEAKASARRGK